MKPEIQARWGAGPLLQSGSMKLKRVRGVVLGVFTLGVIGVVVGWWGLSSEPAPVFKTAVLERGSLQATVSATGTLNPVRQVQISSQVSGQIKELLVDFNSPVQEGQLIARLDPETFEYRVRQASADLMAVRATALTAQANVAQALAQASKAEVDLEEAQRDWQRKQELVAQNFIAASEADKARALVRSQTQGLKAAQALVDVARAQYQSAQATIQQREAVLQQAQVDVRRTQIRSPVEGIVIKRTVEVGQTVAASLQAPELFVIARNLHDMQVEASIDEADVAKVKQGQKATFTIDAFPGRSFDGQVTQVRQAAVTLQNVTTYTVIIGFTPEGGPQPLPGMTANVRIVTDVRDNALKLPNAALRVRLPGVEPLAEAASGAPPRVPGPGPAASAPGGHASGPLAKLRERLIAEARLSPEQITQLDTLLSEQRPRFAALRGLAEDERPKARERLMVDLRARITELFPADRQPQIQQLLSEVGSAASSAQSGRVFLLVPDAKGRPQPQAYAVRLGITDGLTTELLPSASQAALQAGATVITGVPSSAPAGRAVGGAGAGGPRSPF